MNQQQFQLSEAQLNAFYIVASQGSFSSASQKMHLSQPALSRRIQGLEESLGKTLFHRTPQGVELTEEGIKLLSFIQNRLNFEQHFWEEFRSQNPQELNGTLRLSGYSSVVEHVLMPCLQEVLLQHPRLMVHLTVADNLALDEFLNYSKTDFILTNRPLSKKDQEQTLLGYEEYVCIESTRYHQRSNVYLDTTPDDQTTEKFFAIQTNPPKNYLRSYMHDENGILRGVELGLGRAIKPKHTLKDNPEVRQVKGFQSLKRPVYLRYLKKPFYPQAEKNILSVLQELVPKLLAGKWKPATL